MKITKQSPKQEIIRFSQSLECKNCGSCCRYGSGVLENEDIAKIAKFLKIDEKKLKESYLEPITKFNTTLYKPKTRAKPFGECIFFNEKEKCAIHAVNPLNCKIANCGKHGEALNLWFQLNYFINPDDDQSIREYAFYIRTKGKVLPKSRLQDIIKDKKRLKNILKIGGL